MALIDSNAVASTASNAVMSMTTNVTIPVGSRLIVVTSTGTTSSGANGISSISAGGNTLTRDAHSCRASTFDINIWSGTTTNSISAGSTITVTMNATSTRKTAAFVAFSNTGIKLADSGNTTPALGGTNVGRQGSSITQTAATTSAAAGVVVAVFGVAGQRAISPNGGYVELEDITTTIGSSDRGLMLAYLEVPTSQIQSPSATMESSSGWAAASAVYQVTEVDPPVEESATVVVGGIKKQVASNSVIIGGIKKPVVNRWTIVGGVKRPLP